MHTTVHTKLNDSLAKTHAYVYICSNVSNHCTQTGILISWRLLLTFVYDWYNIMILQVVHGVVNIVSDVTNANEDIFSDGNLTARSVQTCQILEEYP